MSLTELSASDWLAGLEKSQFSAREIADERLPPSKEMSHLGGLAHLNSELFYQQADQSDARHARGEALTLDGVPLVLKDNLNTTDMPTAGPMTRCLTDISLLDSFLCQKAPSIMATPAPDLSKRPTAAWRSRRSTEQKG